MSCDLSIGRGCPENFQCDTHDDGENYYCFEEPKEDSGGCRVASGRGTGALFWLGLVGLLSVRRRRRRRAI